MSKKTISLFVVFMTAFSSVFGIMHNEAEELFAKNSTDLCKYLVDQVASSTAVSLHVREVQNAHRSPENIKLKVLATRMAETLIEYKEEDNKTDFTRILGSFNQTISKLHQYALDAYKAQ